MLKKFFLDLFYQKKGADVRAHVRTLKVIYARTRTHIFAPISALICTKIAAPARVRARPHARTLKVCVHQIFDKIVVDETLRTRSAEDTSFKVIILYFSSQSYAKQTFFRKNIFQSAWNKFFG